MSLLFALTALAATSLHFTDRVEKLTCSGNECRVEFVGRAAIYHVKDQSALVRCLTGSVKGGSVAVEADGTSLYVLACTPVKRDASP